MNLYHATFKTNIDNIFNNGLLLNQEGINFSDEDALYFTTDLESARKFEKEILQASFLETSILELNLSSKDLNELGFEIRKHPFLGKEVVIFSNVSPRYIVDVVEEEEDDEEIEIPSNIATTLLSGGVGSGKTYKAIKDATNKGSFVIAVPTRQLAYDVFMDYKEVSGIHTGEIHKKGKNQVCVYENLSVSMLRDIKTLIIDECHFLNDEERGGSLLEMIIIAHELGVKVVLLTATNSLSDELQKKLGIREQILSPFCEIKKYEIKNNVAKVAKNMKSIIVFTKYVPTERDIEYYSSFFDINKSEIALISAETTSSNRLKTQIAFKNGDIRVVLSTNVLAQGVNMPADLVVIEYNEWDEWEIIEQKIGRVGRPTYANKGYYHLSYRPEKNKKVGIPHKKDSTVSSFKRRNGDIIDIENFGFQFHEVPTSLKNYVGFKYSFGFLKTLEGVYGLLKDEEDALQFLKNEQVEISKLLQIA